MDLHPDPITPSFSAFVGAAGPPATGACPSDVVTESTPGPQVGDSPGYEPHCRVCRLSLSNPDLADLIHALRMRGHGPKLIRSLGKGAFEAAGVRLPDAKTLARHFREHGSPGAASRPPGLPSAPALSSTESRAAKDSEVEQLRELLRVCLGRIAALEDAPGGRELVALLGEARQLVTRLHAARATAEGRDSRPGYRCMI